MSAGLAGLLSGEAPAGVYRSHVAAPTPAQVTLAGWRPAAVDATGDPGRAALLRALGRALDFPEWYGANFDALADCLRDLSEPTVLTWDGWERLAVEDHQAFHTALDVLAERCADPEGPAFVVLLSGPGPDLDDVTAVDRLDDPDQV